MLPLIIKVIAGAFAAAFGFYATFHDLRVEKGGQKVLSRRGQLGIALLVLATLFGMSSDVVQGYRDARERARAAEAEVQRQREEAEKRREDAQRMQGITEQLTEQLATSRQTSEVLGVALGTLRGHTDSLKFISGGLGTQLAVTKGVSAHLGGVARDLARTSKTSNEILEETVGRVDALDVLVYVALDPTAVKDGSGRGVLSERSMKLLEDDRAGVIDLTDADAKPILADLRNHYELVRQLVFSEWEIGIALDKEHEDPSFFDLPDVTLVQQGYAGVQSFFIIEVASEKMTAGAGRKGYRGVVCMARYSIPPNRYAGFRRFSDLNGAQWTVSLRADWSAVEVEGAQLSVGSLFHGIEMKKEDFVLKEEMLRGEKTVPAGYFRAGGASQR